MKLVYRLTLAPSVALLFFVAFAAYALFAMHADEVALRTIQTERYAAYRATNDIGDHFDRIHIDALRLISWISVYDEKAVASRWQTLKTELGEAAGRVEVLTQSAKLDEETTALKGLHDAVQVYAAQVNDSIDLATVDANTGLAKMQSADQQYARIKAQLQTLTDVEAQLAQRDYEAAMQQAHEFQRNGVLFVLIAGVFAGVIVRWSVARISREIGGEPEVACRVGRRIAAGDLSGEVALRPGDRSSVLAAMRDMQRALSGIVEQIRRVSAAGSRGDFTQRVPIDGLAGFGLELAQNLNELLGNTDRSVQEVRSVMTALADGDLSRTVDGEFVGAFQDMQAAVNQSVAGLKGLMGDVRDITRAANDGVLDGRINLNGRLGYQRELASEVNALVGTAQTVLSALSEGLHALASGILSHRIAIETRGTFAIARDDFNATMDKLGDTIRQIQSASEVIAEAAAEIADGNSDLAERTGKSVATVERATANMDQQTQSILRTAEHAQQASAIAKSAAQTAERGGAAVANIVQTVGKISSSSKKILEIIGIIDGIAFQTNILALNAAVESARAGEHGRGFAVVATEVRGLAQRSATAAKEIKVLIEGAVNQVADTHAMVGGAGKTMTEIVAAAQRVTDVISEIAAASQEQGAGVEQIGQAIGLVENDLQQNSALVEKAADTVASLDEQARALGSVVRGFALGVERNLDSSGTPEKGASKQAALISTLVQRAAAR